MKDALNNPEFMSLVNDSIKELQGLRFLKPKAAYEQIVKLVEEITHNPKYTQDITCGSIKNCSFCCHDSIYMGQVEADYIKDIIISNKIPFSEERTKIQSQKRKISWNDKACPLLSEEIDGKRSCTIYDNRPIICRTHNSISHPSFCDKSKSNQVVMDVNTPPLVALSFILYSLDKSKLSDKKDLVSMHSMLNSIINK